MSLHEMKGEICTSLWELAKSEVALQFVNVVSHRVREHRDANFANKSKT